MHGFLLHFYQVQLLQSTGLSQGHPSDGMHWADRASTGLSSPAALLLRQRLSPQGGAAGHDLLYLRSSGCHGDRLHHIWHQVRKHRHRLVHGRGYCWNCPDLCGWGHVRAADYGQMNESHRASTTMQLSPSVPAIHYPFTVPPVLRPKCFNCVSFLREGRGANHFTCFSRMIRFKQNGHN